MTTRSPWECGECGQQEGRLVWLSRVCHHCGKLLCGDCQFKVIDGAFGGSPIAPDRWATHCKDCRNAFHPRSPRR